MLSITDKRRCAFNFENVEVHANVSEVEEVLHFGFKLMFHVVRSLLFVHLWWDVLRVSIGVWWMRGWSITCKWQCTESRHTPTCPGPTDNKPLDTMHACITAIPPPPPPPPHTHTQSIIDFSVSTSHPHSHSCISIHHPPIPSLPLHSWGFAVVLCLFVKVSNVIDIM